MVTASQTALMAAVEVIVLVERLLKASAGMSQALALLHFIGAGPADIGKKLAKRMDWFKYLLDNP